MNRTILALLGAVGIGLSGCVGDTTVPLPADHPASPLASSGPVELPLAIAGYKSADQFETPSAEPRDMRHDAMPGMQHGGAPLGAGAR